MTRTLCVATILSIISLFVHVGVIAWGIKSNAPGLVATGIIGFLCSLISALISSRQADWSNF